MSMGTRQHRQRQEDLWITHNELVQGPAHPFYQRLNDLLDSEKFDEFVEKECTGFYADNNGHPILGLAATDKLQVKAGDVDYDVVVAEIFRQPTPTFHRRGNLLQPRFHRNVERNDRCRSDNPVHIKTMPGLESLRGFNERVVV